MSVIQILKDNNFIEDGEIEVYILPDLVKNWPTIKDDDYGEELDLENWEITELNDDKMHIACGGDWQEPLNFDLIPDGDSLKAVNIQNGFESGDGLSDEELKTIILS